RHGSATPGRGVEGVDRGHDPEGLARLAMAQSRTVHGGSEICPFGVPGRFGALDGGRLDLRNTAGSRASHHAQSFAGARAGRLNGESAELAIRLEEEPALPLRHADVEVADYTAAIA